MRIQLLILLTALTALVFTAASDSAVAATPVKGKAAPASKTVSKSKAPVTTTNKAKAKAPVTASAKRPVTTYRTGTAARRPANSQAVYSRSNSRSASRTQTARRGTVPVRSSSWQSRPSEDRYREIQQSLAEKGFYKGEVNGIWSAESLESLKNYQRTQNLEPDGKLGSLSLIALGLGPKRIAAASPATSPSAAPAAVAPPQAPNSSPSSAPPANPARP